MRNCANVTTKIKANAKNYCTLLPNVNNKNYYYNHQIANRVKSGSKAKKFNKLDYFSNDKHFLFDFKREQSGSINKKPLVNNYMKNSNSYVNLKHKNNAYLKKQKVFLNNGIRFLN